MPQIIFMYMTFVFYIKKQLVCIKLFCSRWGANEAEKSHRRGDSPVLDRGPGTFAGNEWLPVCLLRPLISNHQIRLGEHNSLSQKV